MMQVGIMRVPMHERRMTVPMRMRLASRIIFAVRMPMVLIVYVAMLMRHGIMHMLVLVPLG